jgi:hypothetical protein
MQLVGLSPLMAVRTLGDAGGAQPTDVQWRWIILLAVAVGAAWIALGISAMATRPEAAEAEGSGTDRA